MKRIKHYIKTLHDRTLKQAIEEIELIRNDKNSWARTEGTIFQISKMIRSEPDHINLEEEPLKIAEELVIWEVIRRFKKFKRTNEEE